MTSESELDLLLTTAAAASAQLAATAPLDRAGYLRALADALDENRDELTTIAREETHLTPARLDGELTRTAFQFRLYAREISEGHHFAAVIDHADVEWPMGPRPDIRRSVVPLGPVLVYGASNFPFAFGVLGGDVSSAIAAGCAVVVKGHSYHPRLAAALARVAVDALAEAGAPDGTFTLIEGREAGVAALRDKRIRAAGFTGSLSAGRLLFDIASSRPDPIPFYGELSSINPVFVTAAAAAGRADEIAAGFVTSMTTGAGQFCTKPGVLFVPAESELLDAVRAAIDTAPTSTLLHQGIAREFEANRDRVRTAAGVTTRPAGEVLDGMDPTPTILEITLSELAADPEAALVECFGPSALVVTYENENDLLDAALLFTGELTATIHGEPDDALADELVPVLAQRAGRILWNSWPTGVTVSAAQQHGGPYPATTAPSTTSMGTGAISRFLRPVAYQGMPDRLLPAELRDANPLGVPRRVSGD